MKQNWIFNNVPPSQFLSDLALSSSSKEEAKKKHAKVSSDEEEKEEDGRDDRPAAGPSGKTSKKEKTTTNDTKDIDWLYFRNNTEFLIDRDFLLVSDIASSSSKELEAKNKKHRRRADLVARPLFKLSSTKKHKKGTIQKVLIDCLVSETTLNLKSYISLCIFCVN